MYENYPIVLATAAFIKDPTGRFLIVKKSPHESIDAGLWTVPGGKVHPSEPIIASLLREVREEVGLTIDTYKWIGEDVFIDRDRYFHAQHFICSAIAVEPVILEKSLTEYEWIAKDEITSYHFPINIKNRLLEVFTSK
ncbi:hypothetical protein COY90_00720 [Candidatus Roizmanbacteria bacterium CG_4_10_14_0_8_um_filter_39_9]|uniref:8-oxo-dGTP diphosphatase n=1 Tax=Candidatus Roizmanbacteria bacterium CG_4_10_14_0_8_um_filter_39_9 TaxID=1974829 RepID=A0A2M7QET8_9BACT|nr:MAG: hypothetical protein COY90_00720 [Candidatus Roizmanbacteria bacterium CG_4_10_14_0_8_um_filter_39_9]